MSIEKLHEFDPEFSEYNPVIEELNSVKKVQETGLRGIIAVIMEKLNSPILIETD